LKLRDWGKMAATFCDLATGRAVRVVALESSRDAARNLHPEIEGKNAQQMAAYRELADEQLFATRWVSVALPAEELPGYKAERVVCEECGEGISFRREVARGGKMLCRACAGERYWEPLSDPQH